MEKPDETEVVGTPVNELFEDNAGNPEAVVDMGGSMDGVELPVSPIDELFKERVGSPEVAVEAWIPVRGVPLGGIYGGIVREELLAEIVGVPGRAEEVPLCP